mgnify:CR=1 FL=1
MFYGFTEEDLAYIDVAKQFAEKRLAPLVGDPEPSEEKARAINKELAEMGFVGMCLPEEYGGMGATRVHMIRTVLLPSAMPGILSGVILATGRIVGETAALIYTASTVAAVPASVFSSTRTLATHMYLLSNEGLHINETYGTAVVLLILVLLINSLSSSIAGRLAKK